ncbi:glucokinase [Pseudooceanicola sp. MF1-13]|uniref:glucokinase n=1 Tax=Pseudooceanicola sp. MF1-13 TaxID=3379095 RepID=UPI00389265DB
MRLVADIGGTNARLALARDGLVLAGTSQSFRNADHPGFAQLAADYLAQVGVDRLDSMVVAVAGPVGDGMARLTNHDWSLDQAQLSERFAGAKVVLLNDLAALGYALPSLSGSGLATVTPGSESAPRDGQALVAGIGTGFNVCSVLLRGGGNALCMKAEFGHVSLPGSVGRALRDQIGPAAGQFATIEDCFSGAGVSALFGILADRPGVPPEEALSRKTSASADFSDFYAGLVGHLARDLRMAFMPDAGIHFAGSVARAVLSSRAAEPFSMVYSAPTELRLPAMAGVKLILDDAAALKGCAAYG